MQDDWQRWTREVERVHARYQTEVVEEFSFCPWARAAREDGRVQHVVSFVTEPDPLATLELLDRVMHELTTEVGMVIFPLLALARLPFSHFVADVRRAYEARSVRGQQALALADFHPDAHPDARNAQTLVPFLRRAPDPLIQVVRTEVLAQVRGPQAHGTSYVDPAQLANFAAGELPRSEPVSLAARVAEHNFRTTQRVGISQIQRVFQAISADRNSSYAALGMPTREYMEDVVSE